MKNIIKNIENYEYLNNNNSLVINGDSLEILKEIEDEAVDLIFADPPYGIGKDFGNQTDYFESIDEYFNWAKKWIDECMRILKKDGTMYFMTSTQYMPILDRYADKNYFVINRIIWTYDSSGVQSKNKFGSLYEPILMITHNKKSKYKFNYKDIMIEAKTGAKRKLIDYRKTPPQPYSDKKVPGNVWNFNRVRYRMEEYENHPTQDIVLDPFSGSFTTSSVAVRLGRKAIGIEFNNDFYKIGVRRTGISDEYKGEKLKKDKVKKTKNKSKKNHIETVYIQENLFSRK